MTRSQYEQELLSGLQNTPAERRAEIIEDIRCHFSEGLMAGRSEQELCEQLGSVKKLLLEYGIAPPGLEWGASTADANGFAGSAVPGKGACESEAKRTTGYTPPYPRGIGETGRTARNVFASIGVLLLWLIFGIPLVATAVGFYVSLVFTWVALVLSGIACFVALIVQGFAGELLLWEFGAVFSGGIGLCALSVLLFFPLWHLGRWLFKALAAVGKKSVEVIFGRRINR